MVTLRWLASNCRRLCKGMHLRNEWSTVVASKTTPSASQQAGERSVHAQRCSATTHAAMIPSSASALHQSCL